MNWSMVAPRLGATVRPHCYSAATIRLRAVRQRVVFCWNQGSARMPLLGEVFHPAVEERGHAHAPLEHGLGGREWAQILPKTLARMAMRRFGVVSIAVQTQPGRRRRTARFLVGHAVSQVQLDRVRVAFD